MEDLQLSCRFYLYAFFVSRVVYVICMLINHANIMVAGMDHVPEATSLRRGETMTVMTMIVSMDSCEL